MVNARRPALTVVVPTSQVRRYVMEDRFCAIRAAIGTAQARDVVVIAGKGCQDFQEYGDLKGGIIRVWLRVNPALVDSLPWR